MLADELLAADLPDDPFLRTDLFGVLPVADAPGLPRRRWRRHPLRREIVVTQVVNHLVNCAGMTFFHRLAGETNATAEELTRANFVASRDLRLASRWIDEVNFATTT